MARAQFGPATRQPDTGRLQRTPQGLEPPQEPQGGITHDELTTAVARLYGWNRRGPDISSRLNRLISDLAADGRLTSGEHGSTPPPAHKADRR